MTESNSPYLLEKLEGLRTELADLAFDLERQGRRDAADVAVIISARLNEVCDDFLVTELSGRLTPPCPE
jgi:hypothetical protein